MIPFSKVLYLLGTVLANYHHNQVVYFIQLVHCFDLMSNLRLIYFVNALILETSYLHSIDFSRNFDFSQENCYALHFHHNRRCSKSDLPHQLLIFGF